MTLAGSMSDRAKASRADVERADVGAIHVSRSPESGWPRPVAPSGHPHESRLDRADRAKMKEVVRLGNRLGHNRLGHAPMTGANAANRHQGNLEGASAGHTSALGTEVSRWQGNSLTPDSPFSSGGGAWPKAPPPKAPWPKAPKGPAEGPLWPKALEGQMTPGSVSGDTISCFPHRG